MNSQFVQTRLRGHKGKARPQPEITLQNPKTWRFYVQTTSGIEYIRYNVTCMRYAWHSATPTLYARAALFGAKNVRSVQRKVLRW